MLKRFKLNVLSSYRISLSLSYFNSIGSSSLNTKGNKNTTIYAYFIFDICLKNDESFENDTNMSVAEKKKYFVRQTEIITNN